MRVSTAAALHALATAGVAAGDAQLGRARAILRRLQTAEGGFAATSGERADALTTAWVCTALAAAGSDPAAAAWRRGGGPLRYLTRLQRRDGSFQFRPGQVAAPNWVTAQAVVALRGRGLPEGPGTRRAPARAPRIVAREPAAGSPLGQRVIVRYRDDARGTGVDPGAVRLSVNGRDLTGLAAITPFALQIEAGVLGQGPARIRLELADRAGNRRRITWELTAPPKG